MSTLAALRRLIERLAPAQRIPVEEALRRTARTGREHSVVGTAEGRPGRITEGSEIDVIPSPSDTRRAIHAADGPLLDFHTHPAQSRESFFITAPSQKDFKYYDDYGDRGLRSGRELRTLVASPPFRNRPGQRTSYNYFATGDRELFNPQRIGDAEFEIGRGYKRGAFDEALKDPALRSYLDAGLPLTDLLNNLSPLAIMRLRAQQGRGAHEVRFGDRQLTPEPGVTDRRMFEILVDPAVEVLRSRRFARGGLAQMKEFAHG